jgi:hypothetical protein
MGKNEESDKYFDTMLDAGTQVNNSILDTLNTISAINKEIRDHIHDWSHSEIMALTNILSGQLSAEEKLVKRIDLTTSL